MPFSGLGRMTSQVPRQDMTGTAGPRPGFKPMGTMGGATPPPAAMAAMSGSAPPPGMMPSTRTRSANPAYKKGGKVISSSTPAFASGGGVSRYNEGGAPAKPPRKPPTK